MEDYALVLRMNLSVDAPEGAGWYLYAISGDKTLRHPERISNKTALSLAVQMQQAMTARQEVMSPAQIVISGNQLITQRLKEQIEYAETQARRIAQLRRTLAEESDTVSQETQGE